MDSRGIAQQYDGFASLYNQAVADANFDNADYFCHFPSSLAGKFLLDMGCGGGDDLKKFQQRGAVVHGIDGSSEMVGISLAKNPLSNVKVGLFDDIPFDDNSFDYVVSKWAMQTAAEIDPIYKEVARVLKMNGEFIYLTGHPIRQFLEKKRKGKDYFEKEVVESTFFEGEITVKEPSHTMNEYLSPLFFKHFSLLSFHEANASEAERVDGDIYPSYMVVRAKRIS